MGKCRTNKNPGPPCEEGFKMKPNAYDEECCYKKRNGTKNEEKDAKKGKKKIDVVVSDDETEDATNESIDNEKLNMKKYAIKTNIKIAPKKWIVPNDSEYISWIADTFQSYAEKTKVTKTCDSKQTSTMTLFPHQEFVRDYLQQNSPYKGLLLYHGLGVGKTCSSIGIAEVLMKKRKVVVLLPASLRTNYLNEIIKCGNEYYDKSKYYWHFIKDKKESYVSDKISKKHGGVWYVLDDKDSNYETLSMKKKTQITTQIENMIKQNYEFVAYNGLTESKLGQMAAGDKNFFDDKTVIIDEVHNFISAVSNPKSKIASKLNKLILKASDTKIVLLSGTPIINNPFELASIINLVQGYTRIHYLEFDGEVTNKQVENTFKAINFIDEFEFKENKLSLSLTPNGFVNTKSKDGIETSDTVASDTVRVKNIIKLFKKNDLVVKSHTSKKFLPFSDKEEDFNSLFIDSTTKVSRMKNKDLFMRKALGSVSYFEDNDPNLYPSVTIKNEVLDMSDYQFDKYAQGRKDEYKLESLAKKKKVKRPAEDIVSVFKVYSRQLCNFAFPDSIERPKPKEFKKEMDKYYIELQNSINSLTQEHLTQDLDVLSPKFNKVLTNMKESKGTILIYSNFSSVEGVAILSKCLDYDGYAELKIELDGDTWKTNMDETEGKTRYAFFKNTYNDIEKKTQYTNILLGIFNNDFDKLPDNIKKTLKSKSNLRGEVLNTLFITRSGSEGISLKNVRQVHVVEPYWNQNRTDQVIGRANRACSHTALPKDEQNFMVFKYSMKFSNEQIKKNNQIINLNDSKKTTDEVIQDISKRKMLLNTEFLEAIKMSSVDCNIHNSVLGCYKFPVNIGKRKIKSYIRDSEILMTNKIKQSLESNISVIQAPGHEIQYIYVKTTGELFNYELYMKTRILKKVGSVKYLESTKQYEFRVI